VFTDFVLVLVVVMFWIDETKREGQMEMRDESGLVRDDCG